MLIGGAACFTPYLIGEFQGTAGKRQAAAGVSRTFVEVPGIEIVVTGTDVDVVAVLYDSSPADDAGFETGAKYFDIYIPEAEFADLIEIRVCDVAAEAGIRWYDRARRVWSACSPVSTAAGCRQLTVSASSAPTLAQLKGTAFSAGTSPPQPAADDSGPGSGSSGGGGAAGTAPRLYVTGYVSLSHADEMKSFTIGNTGGGLLAWQTAAVQYEGATGWITNVAPSFGETRTTQQVLIRVSRQGLQPGTYTAVVPISSNGGPGSIAVRMENGGETGVPEYQVGPAVIDFGTRSSQAEILIFNQGTLPFDWTLEVTYAEESGWLTIEPTTGHTTGGQSGTVSVAVSREGLGAGLYSAAVRVKLDADHEETIPVLMEVLAAGAPQLRLERSGCFFIRRLKHQAEVTLFNEGSGILEWEAGEPDYGKGSGWITVSPRSGALDPGDTVVLSISVDRRGLPPGFYRAYVPIRSNGGQTVLRVLLRNPVF